MKIWIVCPTGALPEGDVYSQMALCGMNDEQRLTTAIGKIAKLLAEVHGRVGVTSNIQSVNSNDLRSLLDGDEEGFG
jgi:hypothetical protein